MRSLFECGHCLCYCPSQSANSNVLKLSLTVTAFRVNNVRVETTMIYGPKIVSYLLVCVCVCVCVCECLVWGTA